MTQDRQCTLELSGEEISFLPRNVRVQCDSSVQTPQSFVLRTVLLRTAPVLSLHFAGREPGPAPGHHV